MERFWNWLGPTGMLWVIAIVILLAAGGIGAIFRWLFGFGWAGTIVCSIVALILIVMLILYLLSDDFDIG